MDTNQRICERVICKAEDSSEYYEDSMDESSVDYTEDSISMSANSLAQSKWLRNDANRHLLVSIKRLIKIARRCKALFKFSSV